MRIDLHTHSAVSDGTDTPTMLVQRAVEAELDIIGLTDHDTFDGLLEARTAAATVGVRVASGIEISTQAAGRSVHLLGYGCDPHHRPLLDELARIRVDRTGRLPAMAAKLSLLGMPLTVAEITIEAGAAPSLGRPHVADAMVRKGYVKNRQEAFDQFLGDDGPAYVGRYACELRQALRLVREARGVAVIAHPWGRGRRSVLPEAFLTELTFEHGLEGIEVDHNDHDAATRVELGRLADRLGLIKTGSSDYHGRGKVDHDLGCNLTDPDAFAEIERRGRARGSQEWD